MAKKRAGAEPNNLVVVESPTKATTVRKYLGDGFDVEASVGHVRDLVTRKTELAAGDKRRSASWVNYGINVENGFEPLEEIYRVPASKKRQMDALKAALKRADVLYLATDDDREGEAISWHLIEELKPKIPVKRLVFHEITHKAVQRALANPRDLDMSLVNAQRTRRVVDRLYGWDVSQLLWRKIKPGLSAGRVQSVALRLLVERERERIAFTSHEYWEVGARLRAEGHAGYFDATLQRVGERRVATSRDFDARTGAPVGQAAQILDASAAQALVRRLEGEPVRVTRREVKPQTQRPSPPYTTSTLQQDANRRLRYSAQRTMRVAQALYESGFITYMRTDSTRMSEQAVQAARSFVAERFGAPYLPQKARRYATKTKGAQEAHEAIRPAGDRFVAPEQARRTLSGDQLRLYELIFKRTIASQMNDALLEQTSVDIEVQDALFRATGRTVRFDGHMRAWATPGREAARDATRGETAGGSGAETAKVGKIAGQAAGATASSRTERDKAPTLPPMTEGDLLLWDEPDALEARRRQTRPRGRLNDATLVKALEDKGIGRPSTYATIIQHLLDRAYCFRRSNQLVPTFMGMAVVKLLEEHLPHLVDYNFTAAMEARLDAIARGESDHGSYLRAFYNLGFEDIEDAGGAPGLKPMLAEVRDRIDPAVASALPIGELDGEPVVVRIGRYGTFVRIGEHTAGVPEDQAPDELDVARAAELIAERQKTAAPLGTTADGTEVFLRNGRYGWYLQLGRAGEGEKPKMVSLSKGMKPEQVDVTLALRQLALPRTLGPHPDSNIDVTAHVGRFGDFLRCGDETRSLPAGLWAIDVTLEEAVALLATPRRRGREMIRELGARADGVKISLWTGRWGPYVTDGSINKTLGDIDPDTLGLDEAVAMLAAAREAKHGKVLGKDPTSGEDVRLLDGRFGAYVTDGAMNASLPRGVTREEVDLSMALELLVERGKPVKRRPRRGAAAKKTAAKKKTAKKTPAKKTPAKKTATKKTATKKTPAKKTATKKKTAGNTAATSTVRRRRRGADDGEGAPTPPAG